MTRTYNYTYLLVGLLLLVLVNPFAEQFLPASWAGYISNVAALAILLGLWSLGGHTQLYRYGLGLALGAIAGTLLSIVFGIPLALILGQFLILTFCVMSVWLALDDIFNRSSVVTSNQIIGALCVYLLFGVIWAFLYEFVEYFSPGSFKGLDSRDGGQAFVYYSFVTLTTLGYGDVVPIRPVAMALAYLQAVFGQVYLAVLVAGLVGMRVSSQPPKVDP